MFGDIFDAIDDISKTITGVSTNRVARSVLRVATQPIVDAAIVFDGLTEVQLRHKAALRLGADIVAGMAISEIIDYLY